MARLKENLSLNKRNDQGVEKSTSRASC